jgi:ubiquinone/menaquinone biosynthesis C-methylase UbiE
MSPKVFEAFNRIAHKRFFSEAPEKVLEVGAGAWTLLDISCFQRSEKYALNMRFDRMSQGLAGVNRVLGNCNSMEFLDDVFDCVMSCSMLEHDRYFWKSISEIHRVLKKGGVFIVGVPIYMTLPTDLQLTTLTYARHGLAYNADFYRFSEQAVREVFFDKYSQVIDEVLVRRYPNPYVVMAGRK